MKHLKKYHLFFLFVLLNVFSFAQDGTHTSNEGVKTAPAVSGKIVIVPFEPKLYMSEIDQKINQVTKWNFNQIRENFRHQLDAQLKLKLQSILPVVSFYADSTKMSKDLEYVYLSTHLTYDLVDKPTSSKSEPKPQSGIKNGQIEVEVNNEKKFMNTKFSNTEALNYLNKKYEADYFVFVNELDINNKMDSYDISTDTYQREVAVHYSIIDKAGKTLGAGLATSSFSSRENNPKKIVSESFSTVAATIAAKFSAIVHPAAGSPKK